MEGYFYCVKFCFTHGIRFEKQKGIHFFLIRLKYFQLTFQVENAIERKNLNACSVLNLSQSKTFNKCNLI